MPAVGKRVLVVDDDQDIRETLAELLTDEGYLVESASNGREALTTLRNGVRPDVILLDLMMPVMDGYQFRDEQRADPLLASIPVIVITAGSNPSLSALGANMFVPKPLDLGRLLDSLSSVT
jgi:CheY-like chemotaxis protein